MNDPNRSAELESLRVNYESRARDLFQRLDPRFSPQATLVGIPVNDSQGQLPLCIGPNDDLWLKPEMFQNIAALADSLLEAYPESRLKHSDPAHHRRNKEALSNRALSDALIQIINDSPSNSKSMEYSASLLGKKDRHLIFLVIGLQVEVIRSYKELSRKVAEVHGLTRTLVSSLIQATVGKFLDEAAEVDLQGPSRPNTPLASPSEANELIRRAGEFFMTTLAFRTDPEAWHLPYVLFHSLNAISSLRYESGASDGAIILARHNHPSFEPVVTFSTPTDISAHGAARKLLELGSKDLALWSDSIEILGLGRSNEYNSEEEDVFKVVFLGHHDWEVRHAEQPLMRVRYGEPQLPHLPFNQQELRAYLGELFPNTAQAGIDKLVALIDQAEKTEKGTILVVSEKAQAEADRLKRESTPVVPFSLEPEVLESLTSVDGALLINPDGTCYAFGVILDGQATESGDPSRGSRYNSAVRYVNSQGVNCLAVVVSEDGGVDFVAGSVGEDSSD